MKLHGIDFGSAWAASGVQGFWGEGYPFHRPYRMMFPGLFTFKKVTFVAKTITLDMNLGNMPLNFDGTTPKEFRPKCIVANFRAGAMLNAVGLSNFGASFYLDDGRWQSRTEPFILSFMCIGKTRAERVREISEFVRLLKKYLAGFKARIALQINFSCPNVGHNLAELMEEVEEALAIASELDIPLIPKFNALIPPEKAAEIAENRHCDAICVSNTIPWGELPDKIDWVGLFGSATSPLEKYGFGKGGLSGAPITAIVQDWVRRYAELGVETPLNAGGGIMSLHDVDALAEWKCVQSIFVGSVAPLRPWRLRSIIGRGNYWGSRYD